MSEETNLNSSGSTTFSLVSEDGLTHSGSPDDREVWTGSCPCQPFSVAGKGLCADDERHLWPYFRNLIGECRPAIVLGEQVASADGREWLAGVSANLEALAYRFAAADLCAAGVKAPYMRQRLYWLAVAAGKQRLKRSGVDRNESRPSNPDASISGIIGGMANASNGGFTNRECPEIQNKEPSIGAWDRFDVLPFRDGKQRRVEARTFPLAHGIPGRVGLLRGYGNAIVPQLAAEFIQASQEAIPKMI